MSWQDSSLSLLWLQMLLLSRKWFSNWQHYWPIKVIDKLTTWKVNFFVSFLERSLTLPLLVASQRDLRPLDAWPCCGDNWQEGLSREYLSKNNKIYGFGGYWRNLSWLRIIYYWSVYYSSYLTISRRCLKGWGRCQTSGDFWCWHPEH